MAKIKTVVTEEHAASSFAPLESPYSGLRVVAGRIRENMAQAEKYLAAIERDLATFEAAFRTAHGAAERPESRAAAADADLFGAAEVAGAELDRMVDEVAAEMAAPAAKGGKSWRR